MDFLCFLEISFFLQVEHRNLLRYFQYKTSQPLPKFNLEIRFSLKALLHNLALYIRKSTILIPELRPLIEDRATIILDK